MNIDALKREINPAFNTDSEEKQSVLNIDYDLTNSPEISFIQRISKIGYDFSKKVYLEMWVHGDGNGEELIIS